MGALLHEADPSRILAALGRRDELIQGDWFMLTIDGYRNQESGYTFAVNAGGVQYDAVVTGPGFDPAEGDPSWDAIWESETRISEEGWIAEMRIPYSMLRFAAEDDVWGIHIHRRMPRVGERVEWPLIRQNDRQNYLANFGDLTNLEGVNPERNLQVRPYTMSRLNSVESTANPGEANRTTTVDVGGDVKVGISSNVTLDATVNPDFGQVESDPAELNLTAFETFFPEKRPFFLEGVQIYQFPLAGGGPQGGSNLLYTRRIGANAPIVGATKLSGRSGGGLSFGFLGATTGHEFNPDRHYGVARLSQQIGTYSSAGGILTGFSGPAGGARHQALTGGADWDLRYAENRYGVDGWLTFTHQRRTETPSEGETGLGGQLQWAKRQGTVSYTIGTTVFDEAFDPNDVGRMRRNNYVNVGIDGDYQVNGGRPFWKFNNGFVFFGGSQQWSYLEGIDQGFELSSFSNWTLKSFRHLGLNFGGEYWFGGYDLYETRGLGPAHQPAEYEVRFEFGTDERRDWRVEPYLETTFMENGGREYRFNMEGEWTAGTRLSFTGEAQATWERDAIAWSSNDAFLRRGGTWGISTRPGAPDELGPADYQPFDSEGTLSPILADVPTYRDSEAYYLPVFGERDTRELDLTLRSNVTFTPEVSLQFYGQLFLARGQYQDFRLQTDRDTRRRFEGYPKRDEFTLSSFQFNSVLRWEYQPGSRIYLVWTQSRRADLAVNPLAPTAPSPYDTPLGEQVGDTFGLFPHNVFMVKVDYTILR